MVALRRDIPYTVVVPCYNAARTLGRALAHIGRLEPAPREVLIVDDGSTDESPAIAERQAGVTLVRLPTNGGAGRARNVGARRASQPFILFVDSDCYLSPAGFATAVARLAAESGIVGVMGVFARETPTGPFAGLYKNYFRHLEIADMRNPPPAFTSSCFLIRRDAFLAVGGFDERFGRIPTEDNEFYFRVVRNRFVIPYLVEFDFVHDKPMSLSQFWQEDVERARAIVLNARGFLGEPGRLWRPSERAALSLEIAAGNLVALGPGVLLTCWVVGLGGWWTIGVWLGAVLALVGVLRGKLRFAARDRGVAFAVRLYVYRVVEMVAAAAGCVRGMLARRALVECDA